jgi:hypothetical protein
VCGLRPTTDIVLELIQPHGTCWQRKTGSKRTSARALRAGGVFESFARQQFSAGCWARPGRDEVDLYELRHACATPLLTTRA